MFFDNPPRPTKLDTELASFCCKTPSKLSFLNEVGSAPFKDEVIILPASRVLGFD